MVCVETLLSQPRSKINDRVIKILLMVPSFGINNVVQFGIVNMISMRDHLTVRYKTSRNNPLRIIFDFEAGAREFCCIFDWVANSSSQYC